MTTIDRKINEFFAYLDAGAVASASALFPEIATDILRNLYPLAPLGGRSPKYLIHYTSLDTLFSMLDRVNPDYLRLYDTIHTNDPTEGRFFRESLQTTARSVFDRLPRMILRPEPDYAYIASFVRAFGLAAADKLDYWLAYGRKGYGCSIAVPLSDFSTSLPILRVQYGRPATRRAGERLVSFLDRFPTDSSSPGGIYRSLFQAFGSIPYFHKPHSYRYEAECRLLVLPQEWRGEPTFQLRTSSDGSPSVRHYLQHPDLRLQGIFFTGTVITLGPSISERENVRRTICSLLRHHRLSGPDVAFSRIPYRPS